MTPSLKKILPITIAQNIPGIEPIVFSKTIDIGETYINNDTVEFYWVRVPYNPFEIFFESYEVQNDLIKKMSKWCTETFGDSTSANPPWVLYNECTFCFRDRKHRDWFLLKWG